MDKNLYILRSLIAAIMLIGATAVNAGVSIPYTNNFDSDEALAEWTSFNNDPVEETWYLGNADYGGLGARSDTNYSTREETDNWLVSPAIDLTAGSDYILRFKAFTSYYNDEHLIITISRTQNPLTTEPTVVRELTIRNYYGQNFEIPLPAINASGEYYIGVRHKMDALSGMMILINNLSLDVMREGSLAGAVMMYDSNVSGDVPVAGATVTAEGAVTVTTLTDAEGRYSFEGIPSGSYKVVPSKVGYRGYSMSATVEAGATATADLRMYAITTKDVTGTVTDKAGTPIAGAAVALSGYHPYKAVTDAQGIFTFKNVYLHGDYTSAYTFSLRKNNFESFEDEVSLRDSYYDEKITLDPLKLDYKLLAADAVEAAVDGDNVKVDWTAPVDRFEMSRDNGDPSENTLGFSGGHENNIVGSIYRQPMNIQKVRWYQGFSYEAIDNLTIYIIDLDENGEPTGELLYTATNVPSAMDQWNEFVFPRPVSAPRGFLVGLSGEGYVALAFDNSLEVVGGHTQLASNFYNSPEIYRYLDDSERTGALMLRAVGDNYEENPSDLNVDYTLYRLTAGQEENAESWTTVADKVKGRTYTDATFADAGRGSYRYAVKVNYLAEGASSEAKLSEPVAKDQTTTVTVNVTTNSAAEDAEGATVRLTADDEQSFKATVIDGKAVLDEVWKGVYTLSVEQRGFIAKSQTVDLSTNSSYSFDVALAQNLVTVTNIDVVDTDVLTTKQLRWDLFADFTEDFDGDDFRNFEINAPGARGWSYIDGDAVTTYGFSQTQFPGMRERMAAVVMNWTATEPPLGVNTAHSGDRSLAFFAAYPSVGEGGIVIRPSDDWLISPELNFHKDFKMKFFARTYEAQEGRLETIRVGYSTTGKAASDFTFDNELIGVPEDENFTEFTYDIPKEARYVALNSQSNDVFMLLVDDITFTSGITHSSTEPSAGKVNGYKVWLDDKEIGTTTETSYTFTGLAEGQHTAAVSKLYPSGESEKLTVDFFVGNSAIGDIAADEAAVGIAIDANNQLSIDGLYTVATIYNLSGIAVRSGIADTRSVDLSDLPAGVYIVKVDTASGRAASRKISVR